MYARKLYKSCIYAQRDLIMLWKLPSTNNLYVYCVEKICNIIFLKIYCLLNYNIIDCCSKRRPLNGALKEKKCSPHHQLTPVVPITGKIRNFAAFNLRSDRKYAYLYCENPLLRFWKKCSWNLLWRYIWLF